MKVALNIDNLFSPKMRDQVHTVLSELAADLLIEKGKKKREMVIKFSFTPTPERDGVYMDSSVTSKLPARELTHANSDAMGYGVGPDNRGHAIYANIEEPEITPESIMNTETESKERSIPNVI